MSNEAKVVRSVKGVRVLAFIGPVVIWFVLIAFSEGSKYINMLLYLILAAYLARSAVGIGATSAVCDTDDEIRAKLGASKTP